LNEAVMSDARRDQAARELGLSVRPLQCWGGHPVDGRPLAKRPTILKTVGLNLV